MFGTAPVAQWIEHRPSNPMVAGSTPVGGTFLGLSGQILRLYSDNASKFAKGYEEKFMPLGSAAAIIGAADGNRTRVICLEGRGSTIELQPQFET